VPLCLRLIAGHELAKEFAFALQALLERQDDCVAHRLDAGGRRFSASQPPGQLLGGVRKSLTNELIFAIADDRQRPAFGDDAAGECDRIGGEVTFDDFVDDPIRQRLAGPDRIAGDDHLQRFFRSHQAWQPLRAAGARQQAELDLGQADLRCSDGHPEMTSKRQLEPAAQRGPVHCSDHRLRDRLYRCDHVVEARRLGRLAKLGNVGAGKEGAAGTGDDDRLDRTIVAYLPERLGEPRAHFVLEGIDRRVVDGHDRDLAVALEIDAGVDAAHNASRPSRLLRRE